MRVIRNGPGAMLPQTWDETPSSADYESLCSYTSTFFQGVSLVAATSLALELPAMSSDKDIDGMLSPDVSMKLREGYNNSIRPVCA